MSYDIAALPSHLHNHVPYTVILLQALKHWASQNDGAVPKTSAEKDAFRLFIKKQANNFEMEENYREAHNNAWRCFATKDVSINPQLKLTAPFRN